LHAPEIYVELIIEDWEGHVWHRAHMVIPQYFLQGNEVQIVLHKQWAIDSFRLRIRKIEDGETGRDTAQILDAIEPE
jgi:hypothetical protein